MRRKSLKIVKEKVERKEEAIVSTTTETKRTVSGMPQNHLEEEELTCLLDQESRRPSRN